MSISCIGVELIEHEGKGVKRTNHQVLDLEFTRSTVAMVDDQARVRAIRHSGDPRPDKRGKRDGDSGRSEKRKKSDVVISDCAERTKAEGRRTDSFKVQKSLRGDNPSIVGRKRDFAMYNEEVEQRRDTRKSTNVLVSPEKNRWSMAEVGTGAEDATKSSDVHDGRNFNNETTALSEEKRPLLGGHGEVKRSKDCAKRSRDGNLRSVVEAKKKKSATDLHRTEVLACKSQPKGINYGPEYEPVVEKEISSSQLKAFRPNERVEVTQGSRWASQASNNRHRRYGENHTRCFKDGSQEGKELKAQIQDRDVPVKHSGRRIIRFHGGSVSFDSPLCRKDRLVRAISDYNVSPAPHVTSRHVGQGQDGIHRRLTREIIRDRRAGSSVESGLNTVSNRRERDDGFTTTPTCRVQECEKNPNQSHRHADYSDRGFVKEKLKLSSRAVRSDGCPTTDLTQAKYENTSVITNVWEVKRKFSSKVVVPKMGPDEPHSRAFLPEGDNFLLAGDQEDRKNLKVLANRGQDRSQKGTELEKRVKKESSTTRETSSQKFEGTGRELTAMDYENTRLVSKTKGTGVELSNEGDKTGAKLCNIKERQTRRKLRDTKEKSELQGKDDNSWGALALSKRGDGLRNTRAEGTVSRMSTEIRLSEAIKGGKERTVKSKESLLRRHAIKVGRARDDGGQHLSSHEPKRHKHRGRSYTVSPKLSNHTPQKKEHGKSMSPRGSEMDLSNWEQFERERNNTLAAFDSRYRRFGGGTSGLGGYSPRRRRSEAAIKTPSPPSRSPERRKPRAWDLPPPGMDRSMVAAISAAHQAVAQQAAIQHAAAALASVTPIVSGSMLLSPGATSGSASCGLTPAPTFIPSLLQQVNPAVTAVTLTQATRPLRRLYVGNVPATVSDGELLEFLNAAMLSANANYLAGTKPCINCSVNVDKSYAFAEFITPEDATAALAFDGVTLHGTTLKIRRPKDFTQPANGGAENASPIHDMVSSTVPDSPRKVFVGGISSSLSAEKVKEIVTAFGQLKAYHWEVDKTKQPPQACAFLEYMDPTATLRACAGLNGMKLGTRFLTVVQATPDASTEVASTKTPSYGVPDHAKALLQAPSRILELQNMVTEDEMRSMSKQEIHQTTEDIRVECSRFGNVRSMHIVQLQFVPGTRHLPSYTQSRGADGGYEGNVTAGVVNLEDAAVASERSKAAVQSLPLDASGSENLRSSSTRGSTSEGAAEISRNTIPVLSPSGPIPSICCRESCDVRCKTKTDTPGTQTLNVPSGTEDLNSVGLHVTATNRTEAVKNCGEDTPSEFAEQSNVGARTGLFQEESDAPAREVDSLHVGKVYVEFSREESACQAAHNLHGRTFAGRTVNVSYFSLKAYQKRFRKGIGPRTYEEKQALALAVQGHLTAHIKD